MNGVLSSGANAGALSSQSVAILNGFYPSNALQYGLDEPCDQALTGCGDISFIKKLGASEVTFTSVCTFQEGVSWCRPQNNGNTEEAALRVATRHARTLGQSVSSKPFVLSPRGGVLASYSAPGSSSK